VDLSQQAMLSWEGRPDLASARTTGRAAGRLKCLQLTARRSRKPARYATGRRCPADWLRGRGAGEIAPSTSLQASESESSSQKAVRTTASRAGVRLRREERKKAQQTRAAKKRPSPKTSHTHTRRRHAGGQDKGSGRRVGEKKTGPGTGKTTQTIAHGWPQPARPCVAWKGWVCWGGPVLGAWGRWLSGPSLGSNATATAR
jgi:hypothetical protein